MVKNQYVINNGNKVRENIATRRSTGNKNQSQNHGFSKPISFGAALSKCRQGRRHINIACNVTKVKHITVGKLRKQFQAGALWI